MPHPMYTIQEELELNWYEKLLMYGALSWAGAAGYIIHSLWS